MKKNNKMLTKQRGGPAANMSKEKFKIKQLQVLVKINTKNALQTKKTKPLVK